MSYALFSPLKILNSSVLSTIGGLLLFFLNLSLWGNYEILYIIGIVLLAVGEAGLCPLLNEFLIDQLRKHELYTNTNDDGVEDGAEADVEDRAEDRVDDDGSSGLSSRGSKKSVVDCCLDDWTKLPSLNPPIFVQNSKNEQVEVHRLQIVDRKRNNLEIPNRSIFWLAQQFCVLCLLQGSGIKGLEEFMIGELPKSLKNYASAMNGFVVDLIGNFLGILFVYAK
ncbi:hypothetical protein JRO89_XS15G0027800 [Xanthoceras sorbifolium]|uniref:Solute carrier family 40 protein n=1 Tax=Xanthoceras sorbifolium TaxID=99658 RepID=A0ABQ8H0U7_9ROSI|nr:hypothetical protein JRO89_XS15G0027800 [Xanthoceras sorbifolium]